MTKHIIFVLFALLAGGLLLWLLVPQRKKKEKADDNDDDDNDSVYKKSTHTLVILILTGVVALCKIKLEELWIPLLVCAALYFVYVGWFLDRHHDIGWGKAAFTVTFFILLVMLGVRHYTQNREDIRKNVETELHSFNWKDLQNRYQRPIEWLWKIDVFRDGQRTNRSSREVRCVEWTASSLVLQIQFGGNTVFLEWNDSLRTGQVRVEGSRDRTSGGLTLYPSDIPGPEVSRKGSQPTRFEGSFQFPVDEILDSKETLTFVLEPRTSYEELLRGWIPGGKKL
jgi:hypothetical protein